MLLASLTTGHKLGLGLVALGFIVFALVCSLVIPHYRPDFPSKKGMKVFLLASFAFFVAMLLAIEIFGVEKPEAEAQAPETTATTPAETSPTETTPAGTTTTEGPAAADVARGEALYTSLGCAGCHSLDGSAGTGPTFKGLYDSQVTLTGGQHTVADDAYLDESIADPDAKIVDGYTAGLMSAVIQKGQIPEADVQALVAFIESQK